MFALKTKAMLCILVMVVMAALGGCQSESIKIVTPTPSPILPIGMAFKSAHGRYVTAKAEDDHYLIRQELELGPCAWFIQHRLDNGKIALETCNKRYVTAPVMATAPFVGIRTQDWILWQQTTLSGCGQFTPHDLRDEVAFETCANRFLTAGNDSAGWEAELQWSVIGQTEKILDWERFTVLHLIASFDNCARVTYRGGEMGEAHDSSFPDKLAVSFVKEAGRGCTAKLAYDIVQWSAFWIKLGDVDLSPYSHLVFDIKADSQKDIPEDIKIELKRAGNSEVSSLHISGITTDWQTMSIDLKDLEPTDYTDPLSSLVDMEELVFVFKTSESGKTGVIYLDNIALVRGPS